MLLLVTVAIFPNISKMRSKLILCEWQIYWMHHDLNTITCGMYFFGASEDYPAPARTFVYPG